MNDKDYFRFIHNLYEFNDQDWVRPHSYQLKQSADIASRQVEKKKRKLLVDIHTFCLMPNHYHLLLSPRVPGGVSQFMKKLNMGYAKYFNQKYKRTGALFEGRYKSVPIKEEPHFIHIPYYIHLNALDLCTPEWRFRKMSNPAKAIKFLDNYRWSSYLDYIGIKNFPSVTARGFLNNFIRGPENYRKETISWIKDMDLQEIKKLTLE